MRIENTILLPVPVEQAFEVLTDLPLLATCLPGARLTASDGQTYDGTVDVRLGPMKFQYAGTAALTRVDHDAHIVIAHATGRDRRGSGTATAEVTAQLEGQGSETRVHVETDLTIAGAAAQFGQGIITDVSERLFRDFTENISGKVQEVQLDRQTSPAGPGSGDRQPSSINGLSVALGPMAKRLLPAAALGILVAAMIRRHARNR